MSHNQLLRDALDLVPRISGDDPMAPALADWCRQARAALRAAVQPEAALDEAWRLLESNEAAGTAEWEARASAWVERYAASFQQPTAQPEAALKLAEVERILNDYWQGVGPSNIAIALRRLFPINDGAADQQPTAQPAAALYPGCLYNGTGYHRPNTDGTCSDCDERLLSFSYDPRADVLTVESVKYAGGLFRDLGMLDVVGDCFEIVKREDGVVWLRNIPSPADQQPAPQPDAVLAEREACAALCYSIGDKQDGGHSLGYRSAAWECAARIRARSTTDQQGDVT